MSPEAVSSPTLTPSFIKSNPFNPRGTLVSLASPASWVLGWARNTLLELCDEVNLKH